MLIIEKIFISFTAKLMGKDEFGNKYYESYLRKDYLGRKARYVMYNGIVESSKVPPMWHSWLHHLSNNLPDKHAERYASERYFWEKAFVPNLSGTNLSYAPVRKLTSNDYKAWVPNSKIGSKK